jgi:hypothetical protein
MEERAVGLLRTGFRREKTEAVTAEVIKLHNGERHNLYSSPSIIRAIKSRRIRQAGLIALYGRSMKYIQNFSRETRRKNRGPPLCRSR